MTPARAVALAILLALLGGLWLGPAASYRGLLGDEATRLAAAERTLAADRALMARRQHEAVAIAAGAVLFPRNSDAQAAALLQEMLKRAAASAAVEIEGIEVLQPESLAGANRMTVRLKARADIAGLQRLLYAIEASRPVLYPDNLAIEARAVPRGAAPAPLEFQVDVSGFKPGAPT